MKFFMMLMVTFAVILLAASAVCAQGGADSSGQPKGNLVMIDDPEGVPDDVREAVAGGENLSPTPETGNGEPVMQPEEQPRPVLIRESNELRGTRQNLEQRRDTLQRVALTRGASAPEWKQIRAINNRISGINGRLSAIERMLSKLDKDVARVEGKVDVLDTKVGTLDTKVTTLTGTVTGVDKKVVAIATEQKRQGDAVEKMVAKQEGLLSAITVQLLVTGLIMLIVLGLPILLLHRKVGLLADLVSRSMQIMHAHSIPPREEEIVIEDVAEEVIGT